MRLDDAIFKRARAGVDDEHFELGLATFDDGDDRTGFRVSAFDGSTEEPMPEPEPERPARIRPEDKDATFTGACQLYQMAHSSRWPARAGPAVLAAGARSGTLRRRRRAAFAYTMSSARS